MLSDAKSSRLNANRMLRAKKISAYVTERLQPPYMQHHYIPLVREGEEPYKPEDILELICHDQVYIILFSTYVPSLCLSSQVVPPSMTLATIRSHVWKSHGDVVLLYRLKGNTEVGNRALEVAQSSASSTTAVEEGDKGSVSTTTTIAGDGIASV